MNLPCQRQVLNGSGLINRKHHPIDLFGDITQLLLYACQFLVIDIGQLKQIARELKVLSRLADDIGDPLGEGLTEFLLIECCPAGKGLKQWSMTLHDR